MLKHIAILTITAVALVGLVAYLGVSRAPTQEQQEQGGQGMREEQQPVATLPENTLPEIDTSDWQTYRNKEYGFEILYPANWRLPENPEITRFYLKRQEEGIGVFQLYKGHKER